MREDMFKVIVERPRWGSRHAPKAKLRLDKCAGRQRATGHRMALEQAGYTKSLNENLAPLKRYLRKQLGRKWDAVFSDICRHLDTGSTVKMHVREHVDDFVMRNICRDKTGHLMGQPDWGGPTGPSNWRQEFYVDPADGILKDTGDLCHKLGVPTSRQRWKRKKPPCLRGDIRGISDLEYLVKIGEIWYDVVLNTSPACTDEALLNELRSGAWRRHERWRVVSKMQLGKKALRDLEFQNQSVDVGGPHHG